MIVPCSAGTCHRAAPRGSTCIGSALELLLHRHRHEVHAQLSTIAAIRLLSPCRARSALPLRGAPQAAARSPPSASSPRRHASRRTGSRTAAPTASSATARSSRSTTATSSKLGPGLVVRNRHDAWPAGHADRRRRHACTRPASGASSTRSTRRPARNSGRTTRRCRASGDATPAATQSIAAWRSGRTRSTSRRSTAGCFRSMRAPASKRWEVNTIDRTKPYTITGAPRVVKGKVLIGNGGGEYGVRGYFSAYDADTGKLAWRFYTVPGNPKDGFENPELEAAAKTWNGEWWVGGGGGTVWDSMAYDPELDTLYVGTGNGSPWARVDPLAGRRRQPVPVVDPGAEPGHGHASSGTTRSRRATTGTTPPRSTSSSRTSCSTAKPRKVLMQAPKNGFFYVLDRVTGRAAVRGQVHPGDVGQPRRHEDRDGRSRRRGRLEQGNASSSCRRRSAVTTGTRWRSIRRPGSSTSRRCSRWASIRPRPSIQEDRQVHAPRHVLESRHRLEQLHRYGLRDPDSRSAGNLPPDRGYLKAWDPVAEEDRLGDRAPGVLERRPAHAPAATCSSRARATAASSPTAADHRQGAVGRADDDRHHRAAGHLPGRRRAVRGGHGRLRRRGRASPAAIRAPWRRAST